jgi:hypothetical protein
MNKTDIDPAPTIGRKLAETELLIKALSTSEIGQVYTYADMNEICKTDVQIRNTILQTTKRELMKPPYRMVFGTIIGVGIKRLSDEEIPDEGSSAIKRSKNIARKGYKKLGCADISKMSPETKVKHVTTSTILSLFQGAGSRKVRALAEQSARVSNGDMKIGNVATLFQK